MFRGIVANDSKESLELEHSTEQEETLPLGVKPSQNVSRAGCSEDEDQDQQAKEEGRDTVDELARPKKINKLRLSMFNEVRRSHAPGAEDAGTVSHARSIAQTQRSGISKKSKSISIHPPTTDCVWETKSTMPDRESVRKERQELSTLNKLTKQTLSKLNPGQGSRN